MSNLSSTYRIVIFDNDPLSAQVLKALLDNKPDVEEVIIVEFVIDAYNAFRNHFNCFFIDIFTVGIENGLKSIDYVRRNFQVVPICLYSNIQNLNIMEGVPKYWQDRFLHYFKLPKEYPPHALDQATNDVLTNFGIYLEKATAKLQMENLVTLSSNANFTNSQKQQIEEITKSVNKALQVQSPPKQITIIPGVDAAKVEELVNITLKNATESLRLTTNVNIGVLIAGSLLVFASFIVGSITNRWEAIAFGGFGIAGIVTSLITNPLKSIGVSARRLVQLQVAYLTFMSQLAILNQASIKSTSLERSQRMGDEMARTLNVLEETFGK
jgi:hypothetical protein